MSIVIGSLTQTEAPILVSDIVECSQSEVQDRFANSGSNILITYTDRIQREIVRRRRWDWMKSSPQQFITSIGQTKYWLGATGSESVGQVDTALNLTDIQEIVSSSVLDRTGFTDLAQWGEMPIVPGAQNPDGSYLEDLPQWFRSDALTPSVLEIYPAPMKAGDYEVKPVSPLCETTASGALSARTYYVKVSFVDSAGGESTACAKATKIYIPASSVLVVKPPQPGVATSGTGVNYTKYRVYASTTEGSETLQSISTLTTTDWQEPTGGLVAGASPVSTSTLAPLNGFLIQFRYVKKLTRLTATTDELVIPARYIDVVCAGVNWLGAQYNAANARRDKKAADWYAIYTAGVQSMLRDQNQWPGSELFIRPDVDTEFWRMD